MSSDYGNSPYILWIDQDAFKASSASLLVSMENCGYEKVWKFKNVHRMRVFLQRSRASEFIRSGTQFVVITSNQDMRHAVGALQQSDVGEMLGVLIIISPTALFENACRWIEVGKSDIHQRTVVACNWEDIHSVLFVWRTQWRKSASVPSLIDSQDLEALQPRLGDYYSIIDPHG